MLRAIADGTPVPELGDRIDSARGIAASERVAIYRQNYALRLAREVEREYPATRALVGAEPFAAVAAAFVARSPSRSFTLDGYARSLPELLRRCDAIADPARRAAARDLARLERAIARCRAARGPRNLREAGLCGRLAAPAASSAQSLDASLRLAHAPGAELIAFAHDVEASDAAWRERRSVEVPDRRATLLALFRRGARVERLRVARREAPLLRALLRGDRLDAAVASAEAAGLGAGAIGRALERWVAAGLLGLAPQSS
jgi:hypothetical protein